VKAIQAHSFTSGSNCDQTSSVELFYVLTTNSVYEPETQTTFCNSEANGVISNYNALSSSQQQDLLNFLRSL
jgi:hypothetical protein